jgi:hypothetical protein
LQDALLRSPAGNPVLLAFARSLQKRINPHRFDTWIKPLGVAGIVDSTLVLKAGIEGLCEAETKFQREFIEAAIEAGMAVSRVRVVLAE